MAPHQQRVVDEQLELAGRIEKLNAFIGGSAIFQAQGGAEQQRLRRQLNAMEQYDAVLLERIAAFT